MELNFLLAIQELRQPFFDLFFSNITVLGNAGIFWLGCGCFMLCSKKYRRHGILLLLSMLICLVVGNLFLKNMVQRPRPCWVMPEVLLLITSPADYSFPSGHTMHSFAAATAIYFANRKWGIIALFLASLIAFSRMYLFVHYPTDVLAGLLIGVISTLVLNRIINNRLQKISLKGVNQYENV